MRRRTHPRPRWLPSSLSGSAAASGPRGPRRGIGRRRRTPRAGRLRPMRCLSTAPASQPGLPRHRSHRPARCRLHPAAGWPAGQWPPCRRWPESRRAACGRRWLPPRAGGWWGSVPCL